MKIKVLVPLVSPSGSYEPGDEVEWDNEDAERLFKAGYAEPFTDSRVEAPKRGAETAAFNKRKKAEVR